MGGQAAQEALTELVGARQMHIVKNKLVDLGCLGADLRVPLILGVWYSPRVR